MMNDGNSFTDLFQDLMEASRIIELHDGEYHTETVTEYKKLFLFFKKKVLVDKPVPAEEIPISNIIENILFRYDYLFPTIEKSINYKYHGVQGSIRKTVDFKMLWDFCDFVKLAQYVIFYPNSSEGEFYVEAANYTFSKYKEDDNKAIVIKVMDINIRIELEKVEERFSGNIMNIVKLIIRFGEVVQTIICVDEISDDSKDTKDCIFLNNINDIIYDQCYKVFKDIVNHIISESGAKLE